MSYLALVNQKLAYAHALLELATAAHPESSTETSKDWLLKQALLDGAVAHLVCAYRHYLGEIAENYGLKSPGLVTSEDGLVSTLAEFGKAPAEAAELSQLRNIHGGWLASLHRSHESQWTRPKQPPSEAFQPADNLIALVAVEESCETTLGAVRSWYQAFSELVRRQRETSAEY